MTQGVKTSKYLCLKLQVHDVNVSRRRSSTKMRGSHTMMQQFNLPWLVGTMRKACTERNLLSRLLASNFALTGPHSLKIYLTGPMPSSTSWGDTICSCSMLEVWLTSVCWILMIKDEYSARFMRILARLKYWNLVCGSLSRGGKIDHD